MTATTTDRDCNRVAYYVTHADHTDRCTQPEGHTDPCWMLSPERMRPAHRLPVATDEDPFGIRRRGGKHRAVAFVGAASGPNRVDSELRRRLARSVVEA